MKHGVIFVALFISLSCASQFPSKKFFSIDEHRILRSGVFVGIPPKKEPVLKKTIIVSLEEFRELRNNKAKSLLDSSL